MKDESPGDGSPPRHIDSSQTPEPTPENFGRYEVRGEIARGPFGAVYQGWDEELRRDVVVKVPCRDRFRTPQDRERFLGEARLLANLAHPHILPVYDTGRTDDGSCFVVSRFVHGSDLGTAMRQRRFSPPESARLIALLAEALYYAHRQGLVHGDVKPANVLLEETGRPLLVDFGLQPPSVRPEPGSPNPAANSQGEQPVHNGEVSEAATYMAPEQIEANEHSSDGRTDIWALGVILYELLTGQRPFQGANASELFDEILHREPKSPRTIDDAISNELQEIVLRCLQKRIADRYPMARDVAKELLVWLAAAPRASGDGTP